MQTRGPTLSPAVPGDLGPSLAHLGEGGHGHAVGPLLEGAGRLRGEGSGRRAIIGGRQCQVVLVQEVAGAAALPLLEAVGQGQGTVLRQGQAPTAPTPRLAPQGWGDKKLLSGAWVAGTLALGSPPLELGMKACEEDSPEGLVGLGPTATPSPHSRSAPLRPQQPVSCSPEGQEGLGDSWEMAGVPPAHPACSRGMRPGPAWGKESPHPNGPVNRAAPHSTR